MSMVKAVIIGIWISIASLGSFYSVFVWKGQPGENAQQRKFFGGLNYVKTNAVSVPIISQGRVSGYVLARFVYLADGTKLKQLSVPAELLLLDDAFKILYGTRLRDVQRIEKYDLAALTLKMKNSANKRLEMNLIQDVLVESINYIDKSEVRVRKKNE